VDTAPGLYDFLYREYNPIQGRWASPDPAGVTAVNLMNPQTWNRYAYVANAPLNNVDPLGLKCLIDDKVELCAGNGFSFGDTWNLFNLFNIPLVVLVPGREFGLEPFVIGNGFDVFGNLASPANNGSCLVAVSCTPTQNPLTKGNVHCGITTGANGTYTRYDGGPNGSGGDSGHAALSNLQVSVTEGTFPPAGNIIFNGAVSCGVVSCIGQVAYQINTANAPYTLLPLAIGLTPATSNSAAQAMTSSCTLNVQYPSNAPGAQP
jgi:RHS repeat-associated protein